MLSNEQRCQLSLLGEAFSRERNPRNVCRVILYYYPSHLLTKYSQLSGVFEDLKGMCETEIKRYKVKQNITFQSAIIQI